MKYAILSSDGCEEAVSIELKENKLKEENLGGFSLVECKDEEIVNFLYNTQSASKILLYLLHGEFKDIDDLIEQIKKIDYSILDKIKLKDYSFKIECTRFGQHTFNSIDVEKKAGIIGDILNKKINLKHPDLIFYLYINDNKYCFGIDIVGFDLSKRDYRVFTANGSIKGNIAYSLFRLGYENKDKLIVDPACKSGEVPIEIASYLSKKSINYYKHDFVMFKIFDIDFETIIKKLNDKIDLSKVYVCAYDSFMPNLNSAKKNAKIGGLNKAIEFRRINFTWLDLKFDYNVDLFVSNLSDLRDEKSLDELFFSIKTSISKKGRVVFILPKDPSSIIEKHGFKVSSIHTFYSGKQEMKAYLIGLK